MNSGEYLGFVDFIGKTIDGEYRYRFDYTNSIDDFWGEGFNECPACVIPDLQADHNNIVREVKVQTPYRMLLAKKNSCFSMQDCIDGIIPLCFSDINENYPSIDESPLYFSFGEEYSDTLVKLEKCNFKFISNEKLVDENSDDEMMTTLINTITEMSDIPETETILTLSVGETIQQDVLNAIVFTHGFNRVDLVSKEGECAIRGGIYDIFSYEKPYPYRISFFGNTIEALNTFKVNTQENYEIIDKIEIRGIKEDNDGRETDICE